MIKEHSQSWRSFILELVILISIVLGIRFYVFQFFRVSGPSMCHTLNSFIVEKENADGSIISTTECENGKGEFIFVNEFSYHFEDPVRGDIVIFHPPDKKVYYVKRIIGVGGDFVEIKNGIVYLNNEKLPEPYLSERNKDRTQSHGRTKFEVPAGQYLVFGDNRAKSLDARHCFSHGCNEDNTPFLEKSAITGKAEFVIWPFWKARWLENPFDAPASDS